MHWVNYGAMLDDETRGKITAEAAKDLTKTSLEELPAHIAALGIH